MNDKNFNMVSKEAVDAILSNNDKPAGINQAGKRFETIMKSSPFTTRMRS